MRTQLNSKGVAGYAPTFTAAIVLAITFTLSTAFAAIPKNCTDEIVSISKGSGFNMQKFTSDLPVAVAKAKLQAKVPFGKPKDSDKTDIGMTFGCLKVFPESPGEILSLLKDVSQEMARSAVVSQLGTGQEVLQPQQQAQPQYQYPPQPQAQPQYQYPPQQQQPQYQYPPQQAQEQPQQIQPQHQYPPQQYQYPPQYAQPYYPPPQAQPQCPKCECRQPPAENYESQYKNFTMPQRFQTWFLNTIIPIGLGSAAIMDDYQGMVVQLFANTLGTLLIVNSEMFKGEEGIVSGTLLLSTSAIFNIARSATYNKPRNSYSSNDYSGFNLAVLPNKRGEAMPYVMYNKTF